MENFAFCTPTRYIFGRGVEDQAGDLAAALGVKRVLVVYGQGSAVKSGLLHKVTASLESKNLNVSHLAGVKPNPEDDLVCRGIDICRASQVEAIIAVGGGSVIDTAKAIAAGTLYNGDFWDFFSGKSVPLKALPIGVVLTIPAAGSEGSGNAVITKRDTKAKISIRTDYVLRPRFALLNPELTMTLPPYHTAAGIVDMMAHIMERYFSPTEHVEVTDRLCEGLLISIITEAAKVMDNPADYEARANIMWSGTLAHNGICGCGRKEDWNSHAMEHELSALYGVTHGAGLAVVFPAWMTFMAYKRPGKVAQLGRRVLGVSEMSDLAAALQGIDRLKHFFSDTLGMPVTLGQLGIDNPDIDMLVANLHAHKGTPLPGAYYPVTETESAAIYRMMK